MPKVRAQRGGRTRGRGRGRGRGRNYHDAATSVTGVAGQSADQPTPIVPTVSRAPPMTSQASPVARNTPPVVSQAPQTNQVPHTVSQAPHSSSQVPNTSLNDNTISDLPGTSQIPALVIPSYVQSQPSGIENQQGQCHPNQEVAGESVNNAFLNLNSSMSLPTLDSTPPVSAQIGVKSFGTPLGKLVPLTMKEKIWKGNYIDLSMLLSVQDPLKDETPMSFYQVGSQWCFKPMKAQTRPIQDIDRWTTAFFIFMSIYFERHPQRAVELVRYADLIRKFATMFGGSGWLNYDKDFRMMQSLDPNRSWAFYDADLFLEKITMPIMSPGQSPFDQSTEFQSARSHPFCIQFNRGRCSWPRCKYLHQCSRCSKPGHGAFNCFKDGTRLQNPQQSELTKTQTQGFRQIRNFNQANAKSVVSTFPAQK